MCAVVLTVCWWCCGRWVVPYSNERKIERGVCGDGLCGTEPRHIAAVAAGSHDAHSESPLMSSVLKSSRRKIKNNSKWWCSSHHNTFCLSLSFLSITKQTCIFVSLCISIHHWVPLLHSSLWALCESEFLYNSIFICGRRRSGTNPRYTGHETGTHTHTQTLIHSKWHVGLASWPTSMFLFSGRKPENPEHPPHTHTHTQ